MAFSLAPDMDRLVKAGLVAEDWANTPTKGLVSRSVVSLIVRKGNPKNIHTWDDLLKPGVKVLTPNPFTSGAAKWNILAAYGAKSGGGENAQAGLDYLRQLITKHVVVQDKSGREALQNFTSGTGDVLISYENEAITAQKKGQKVDYVIPDQTISIENPIAVVSKSSHPQQAKAFVALRALRRRPAEVRRLGLPPGRPGRVRQEQGRVPDAEGPVHDPTTSAAGRRSTTSSSTRTRARSRRSSRPRGSPLPSEALSPVGAAAVPDRPAPRSLLRGAGRLRRARRSASRRVWLSVIVLIPLAAVVARSTDGGLGAFWDAVTAPQAVAALKLTLIMSIVVAAINAGFGTLVAWVLVRDRFRGRRDRQRADRPAVRAADDRRRHHAARPLRAEQPVRDQRRRHALGDPRWRCCS